MSSFDTVNALFTPQERYVMTSGTDTSCGGLRRLHSFLVKLLVPLFLLIGAFLVVFTLRPEVTAYLVWGPVLSEGPAGHFALVLMAGVTAVFLACPLSSALCLYRAQHGRGLLALAPPALISLMAVSLLVG